MMREDELQFILVAIVIASFVIDSVWRALVYTYFSGTKPSPPSIPTLKQLNDDLYEITWKTSINFGYRTLVYWLEGRFQDVDVPEDENHTGKYTDWILYYNGTG